MLRSPAIALLLVSSPVLAQIGEQPLVAADTVGGDDFGSAVDIDGDRMVIGARTFGSNSEGRAYVFERAGGTWSETATLSAPDLTSFERFGVDVAIDGDVIVVGASLDEDNEGDPTGAVHVFEFSSGSWTRTARLTDESLDGAAEFGFSVAVRGNWIATGAQSAEGGGAAYLYESTSAGWTLRHKIPTASDTATSDFGFAVALADDTLFVGAPLDDDVANNAGAVFTYDLGGGFGQTLHPSGATPLQAKFGYDVAIDGDLLVVGAGEENSNGFAFAGAAYVFGRVGGSWVVQARIEAPDESSNHLFGRGVDVFGDRVLVGAHRANDDDGRAYLFTPDGAGWKVASGFTANDIANSDNFADSVAIDGDAVACGIRDADDAGQNSGRVSAFDLDGGMLGGEATIDLSLGGTQYLTVEAGAALVGQLYLVLGSVSGTSPGLPIDGQLLPLNIDNYFLQTLSAPNSAPLFDSFGFLNAQGRGFARIEFPALSNPQLAGIAAHHAGVAIDVTTLAVSFASHALPLTLVL